MTRPGWQFLRVSVRGTGTAYRWSVRQGLRDLGHGTAETFTEGLSRVQAIAQEEVTRQSAREEAP